MHKRGLQIAVDGGAATGKSTTSRLVAKLLKYTYIDTGAMYRCVALNALNHKTDLDDKSALSKLLSSTKINLRPGIKRQQVYLNGDNVTDKIRTAKITKYSSKIAVYPLVRKVLAQQQQAMAKLGGVVMDGRDIGTTVLPFAELKIFMISNMKIRAERRHRDDLKLGINVSVPELEQRLAQRDYRDSHRQMSPLKPASDAIKLDTSHQTKQQSAQAIAGMAIDYIITHSRLTKSAMSDIRHLAH